MSDLRIIDRDELIEEITKLSRIALDNAVCHNMQGERDDALRCLVEHQALADAANEVAFLTKNSPDYNAS